MSKQTLQYETINSLQTLRVNVISAEWTKTYEPFLSVGRTLNRNALTQPWPSKTNTQLQYERKTQRITCLSEMIKVIAFLPCITLESFRRCIVLLLLVMYSGWPRNDMTMKTTQLNPTGLLILFPPGWFQMTFTHTRCSKALDSCMIQLHPCRQINFNYSSRCLFLHHSISVSRLTWNALLCECRLCTDMIFVI